MVVTPLIAGTSMSMELSKLLVNGLYPTLLYMVYMVGITPISPKKDIWAYTLLIVGRKTREPQQTTSSNIANCVQGFLKWKMLNI